MLRLEIIISLLLFTSLTCIGQDREKAKKLFVETYPLFEKVLELKSTKQDSAHIFNQKLIQNLETIFYTDTTFQHIADYLGNCYSFENKNEKAIYWYSRQLPEFSHQDFPIACYSCIALAYFKLGELDSCKRFILRANTSFDKNYLGGQRDYLVALKKMADKVYFKTDSLTIQTLQAKSISPCKYSIEVLKFLLPFAEERKEYFPAPFSKETILTQQKNCR
jgi:tetratricopeptide (TPR) repeat protein